MHSLLIFILGSLAMLIVWLLLAFQRSDIPIKAYFKTRDGRGVLKGIVMASVFSIGLGATVYFFQ